MLLNIIFMVLCVIRWYRYVINCY